MDQRLDEGFRKTNETFASVMAFGDDHEAQKKIDGLTTNVVAAELLGDKRARGSRRSAARSGSSALPPDAYAFQAALPNGTRVDCLLTLLPPTGQVAGTKFPPRTTTACRRLPGEPEARRSRPFVLTRRHVDAIASNTSRPRDLRRRGDVPAGGGGVRQFPSSSEVVAYAQQRRVWIVSPTTLMAVLNTARAVLKDRRASRFTSSRTRWASWRRISTVSTNA